MVNVTPIQGPALINGKHLYYKIVPFNFIPQILAEKIIINIIIKAYYVLRIIDNVISNLFLKGIMKHYMFVINL